MVNMIVRDALIRVLADAVNDRRLGQSRDCARCGDARLGGGNQGIRQRPEGGGSQTSLTIRVGRAGNGGDFRRNRIKRSVIVVTTEVIPEGDVSLKREEGRLW